MDLLKYLEPMKNMPERFSNLAFWRGVRKLKDEVVNAFEYVDSWGKSIESKISQIPIIHTLKDLYVATPSSNVNLSTDLTNSTISINGNGIKFKLPDDCIVPIIFSVTVYINYDGVNPVTVDMPLSTSHSSFDASTNTITFNTFNTIPTIVRGLTSSANIDRSAPLFLTGMYASK